MYPYAEAPIRTRQPEYRPTATADEVLDVVFGRKTRDGLGRDFDGLLGDTPMMLWAERITNNPDAERDWFAFLGQCWGDVPASVKAELENLAEAAAEQ